MAFKKANLNHPLENSVLPLIDIIQKMAWGDPTRRNSALLLINDTRKRVQESLALSDFILSDIKSIRIADSTDIPSLKNCIILLIEAIEQLVLNNLSFENAVLKSINSSQMLMREDIPTLKNAVDLLMQCLKSLKQNHLMFENVVSSLKELMKQDHGTKLKNSIFQLINKKQEQPTIDSLQRVISSSRSTLKDIILPLEEDVLDSIHSSPLLMQSNIPEYNDAVSLVNQSIKDLKENSLKLENRVSSLIELMNQDHSSNLKSSIFNTIESVQTMILRSKHILEGNILPLVDSMEKRAQGNCFVIAPSKMRRIKAFDSFSDTRFCKAQNSTIPIDLDYFRVVQKFSYHILLRKNVKPERYYQPKYPIFYSWNESHIFIRYAGYTSGKIVSTLQTLPSGEILLSKELPKDWFGHNNALIEAEARRVTGIINGDPKRRLLKWWESESNEDTKNVLGLAEPNYVNLRLSGYLCSLCCLCCLTEPIFYSHVESRRNIFNAKIEQLTQEADEQIAEVIAELLQEGDRILKKRGTIPPLRPQRPAIKDVTASLAQLQRLLAPPQPTRPMGYTKDVDVKMTREEEELRGAIFASQHAVENGKTFTTQFNSQKREGMGNNLIVVAASSLGPRFES